MLGVGSVLIIASLYLALLFTIASRGERQSGSTRARPWRYTLALGVHCTTWAFYGTVTQAAYYGWWFAPTYVGAILIFLFAHSIQMKMLRVVKQQNLTSIADFVGARYGKSHALSAWVAIIALVALVPYIALQLRAVSASFAAVTGFDAQRMPWFNDLSTLVALAMIGFAILFGARRLSLSEQHPGLMDAIAFESIVKLVAFMLVGLFATYYLFDGFNDLFMQAASNLNTQTMLSGVPNGAYVYVTHMLLGALSMFVLPRQFQVIFIENTHENELRTARWAFPLYLFAINFFILPIALAGGLLVPQFQGTDTFMLALPIAADQPLVSLIAFLGGLSAATSMVIMATLALSIMVANDVITPLWVRREKVSQRPAQLTSAKILNIRRLTIAAIIALAYGYHQLTEAGLPLVSNGVIAMALLIQLAPAMLGGLLWRRGTQKGALAGLAGGTLCWFVLLLWPSLQESAPAISGSLEMRLSHGILLSLGANLVLYVLVSMLSRISDRESLQRLRFTDPDGPHDERAYDAQLTWGRLRELLSRFVDQRDVQGLEQRLNTPLLIQPADDWVPPPLLAKIERELGGAIGSAASRLMFESLEQQPNLPIAQVVNWATEASRLYKFNRELLQSSVENIPQGISVIDDNLRLVAWNRRYLEIFDYPDGFIHAGMPVEDLLRYNARRGLFGRKEQSDLSSEVDKRLNFLRQGSSYRYQRVHGDYTIELQGNPMPEGGFVTTYTDITELVRVQQELRRINLELEARVTERTQALSQAKLAAEHAHHSKTRFFAAASHDLMQPFNAATLLCDMLQKRVAGSEQQLVEQIHQSLSNAEELLRMLLEITKLESGTMKPHLQPVAVQEVFNNLSSAFTVVAAEKNIRLRLVATRAVVFTDRRLLQRILQNLLSNALRYTHDGQVLCGVRRYQDRIQIQVLDTGSGIPEDKLSVIFDEFQQLDHEGDNPGLGLGLAIVDRISRLLNLPVAIRSQLGRGTCFSITLPLHSWLNAAPSTLMTLPARAGERFLVGKSVLAVDNDERVLAAISATLEDWGAEVTSASSVAQSVAAERAPDVMLVDYHLDQDETGIDVIRAVRDHWAQPCIPAILNSADDTELTRESAAAEDAHFIPKPVKTAALKRLLKRCL